jgi:hypothetical protein
MKYTITLFFVFVFLFAEAKVSIRGKILNYDGKSIVYYNPTIEGIHVSYWLEVQPNFNGMFKIEYDYEGYGTTRIGFKSMQYRFFHNSNSKIYIEIDQIKINYPKHRGWDKHFYLMDSVRKLATTTISGDFEEINQFYNRNIRTTTVPNQVDGNYYSHMIRRANTPAEAVGILDSLIQYEVRQINEISQTLDLEGSIQTRFSEEIKNFLINEVHAFYGSMFLNGMFLKRKDQFIEIIKDSTAALDIYNDDWERLIEKFAYDTKKNLLPAANSYDYNEMMESLAYTLSTYQEYHAPKLTKSLDDYVKDRLLYFDTLLFSDERVSFAYIVSGLHRYLNDQMSYSPELLSVVYDIQARYPGSKNLAHFEPQIEKLKAYIKSSSEDFDKGIIVKGNYNSLSALLKQFQGKNILLDVWATWCHPCIQDFKYNEVYKPLIDDENLVKLYISIDKPEWDDRWRQGIKYNKLEGYHYRGNHKFIVDMWEVLGQPKGAIPRYALFDKQGNVVVKNGFRPADDGRLLSLIENLLNEE